VVDKAGNVASAGHPTLLDVPLKHVVAGTWDVVKGNSMLDAYRTAIDAVRQAPSSDPDAALTRLDEVEAEFPEFAGKNELLRFELLLRTDEVEAVTALGIKLVDSGIAQKDATRLNNLAWKIVDPEADLETRDVSTALRAAEKAVELTRWRSAPLLDTLARVHAWKGELATAIEIQTKAIELHSKVIERQTRVDKEYNELLMGNLVLSLEEFKSRMPK
jgi:tetratricopeptide (TPR) repeat protein